MPEFSTDVHLLIQVITGGRPKLAERPTSRFLKELSRIGTVEWCIREDHILGYERDAFPFNPYPVEFANEYARTHWRHSESRWEPGGFFGAFPGREWACLSAEERGYDAVLQLDDNVRDLGLVNAHLPAYRDGAGPADLLSALAELSASSNVAMLGAQLNSAPPSPRAKVLRTGYPYSVFIEKVGPSRLPYYGPFEDDIMHALDYALPETPITAGVVDAIRYVKDSKSRTGMRSHYNPLRGLEISRRYPRNVRLQLGPRTSSPVDQTRGVRHYLNTSGFTPVRILDRERYGRAVSYLSDRLTAGREAYRGQTFRKLERRAGGALQ